MAWNRPVHSWPHLRHICGRIAPSRRSGPSGSGPEGRCHGACDQSGGCGDAPDEWALTILAPSVDRSVTRHRLAKAVARNLRSHASCKAGLCSAVASHDPLLLQHANGTLERQVILGQPIVGKRWWTSTDRPQPSFVLRPKFSRNTTVTCRSIAKLRRAAASLSCE